MDLMDRIMELSRQGYVCSQILAIMTLEAIGEEDPGFVRAMGGLNGGIGFSGDCCGCMVAGCCILSYFTGKPDADSFDSPHHKPALKEFAKWFTEEMEMEYRGIDCNDIIRGNPLKRVRYCPQIMAQTFEKLVEILENRGLL